MYTIYHIPGVKVGCTKDLARRMKELKPEKYEIIEELESRREASKRELYWQEVLGYGRDNTLTYEQTLIMSTPIAKQKWKKTIKTSEIWKEAQNEWRKKLYTPEAKAKAVESRKRNCSIEDWNKRLNNPETMAKSLATRRAKSLRVLQYSKQGEFIKEYSCCIEACKETGISPFLVRPCLRGTQKTAGGFIWKYKNN